jgi:hypothetical protein
MSIPFLIFMLGMFPLGPLMIWLAIREIYRRVPTSDRALAASIAGIGCGYHFGLIVVTLAAGGLPILKYLPWAAAGFALLFVVAFPVVFMMMPSAKHLLRNVTRAEKRQPDGT